MPQEINYERIRSAGDHVMPEPFPQYDQDGVPTPGVLHLSRFSPGERIIDRRGERFRVLEHGPMQSATLLRDRNRAMFYADVSQYFRGECEACGKPRETDPDFCASCLAKMASKRATR